MHSDHKTYLQVKMNQVRWMNWYWYLIYILSSIDIEEWLYQQQRPYEDKRNQILTQREKIIASYASAWIRPSIYFRANTKKRVMKKPCPKQESQNWAVHEAIELYQWIESPQVLDNNNDASSKSAGGDGVDWPLSPISDANTQRIPIRSKFNRVM